MKTSPACGAIWSITALWFARTGFTGWSIGRRIRDRTKRGVLSAGCAVAIFKNRALRRVRSSFDKLRMTQRVFSLGKPGEHVGVFAWLRYAVRFTRDSDLAH